MPDIAFWHKCDNRCVMCTNPREFALQDGAQYRLRGQVKKLETWLGGGAVYPESAGGAGYLTLTGGEPTLHPEFFPLLAYYRRRLPDAEITLLSNGRRFASAPFARRFLRAARPPFAVAIPLHGPAAAAHDAVTGVRGSFAQAVAGLKNLLALRGAQRVEIRVVLHRLNAALLPRLLDFILKTFPDTSAYALSVIHYEAEGEAAANARRLGLKLSRSAAAVNACAGRLARFGRPALYHFPRCLVTPELRGLCRVTQRLSERAFPPEKCRGCALRRGCFGLLRSYLAEYGAGELKPRRRRP